MRSVLRTLHLWVGLIISLYAMLIGVTGAILVFRQELTDFEFPQASEITGLRDTPDQALEAVRRAYPGWIPLSVTWPNQESSFWMIYLIRGPERLEVFANPGTGAVTGARNPVGGWTGFLARLHFTLAAGTAGSTLNGYGALLLVFLSVTGGILWWPGRFRIDWRSGWRKLSWQLHHTTGIVALLFIFGMAITGTYFIWYQPFVAASRWFGRTVEPAVGPTSNSPILSLAQLAKAAREANPNRPIQRIQVVTSSNQPVRVVMRRGTPAEFHLVDTVMLHPTTGAVLQKTLLDTRPSGDAILSWFSAVHYGVFGGLPIRLLWAALGLTLPLLSITGVLMWWRRVIEPRRKAASKESPVHEKIA